MSPLPPIAEMQQAYLRGDANYDGLFVLGVRTTGIYCRPTCKARKPLVRNVEFFATAKEAEAAGYRACKRCRPAAGDDSPPWAARLLAEIERDPATHITDSDLRRRGVDPATVRRHFTRKFGMTFQEFTRNRRLANSHETLRHDTLDAAILESGYDSHSGFREAFAKLFGDPPGKARDTDCVRLAWLSSPVGPIIAGATSQGVCLLEFSSTADLPTQFESLGQRLRAPLAPGTNEHIQRLEEELAQYWDGRRRTFTIPLVYAGTPFQRQVWESLLEIPYGELRSYRQIAERVGAPKASRAVGSANGRNRICILIPCQRVVNHDGQLGGYASGLHRKRFLLDLEGAKLSS